MDAATIATIIIAAIGASATAVATVIKARASVLSGNLVTITERNTTLEREVTGLYRWKLVARPYIVVLLGKLDEHTIPHPVPPASLEIGADHAE